MNSKFFITFFALVSSLKTLEFEFGEALGRAGRDLLYWNRMGNRFSNPRVTFRSLNEAYIAQICNHLQELSNESYLKMSNVCKIN